MSEKKTDEDGNGDCNIKVMCRVRPLNQSEEKAGSKFILKFPSEDSISISVRAAKLTYAIQIFRFICVLLCFSRARFIFTTKYSSRT